MDAQMHRLLTGIQAPVETIIVCMDGSCGQCLRCQFLQSSIDAVGSMLIERRGVEALANLRGQALSTIAASLDDDSPTKVGLLQLVEMTPESALALMSPNPPESESTDGQ